MPVSNIILDTDVALDLLARTGAPRDAARAVYEAAAAEGTRVWLVAASLPSLLEELRNELASADSPAGEASHGAGLASRARKILGKFLKDVGVLSSFGFDARDAVEAERPVAYFLLKAADTFGTNVAILSRDPVLLAADGRVMEPQSFLDQRLVPKGPEEPIPFIDLAEQQQRILPELERAFLTVFRHGHFIMGPEIERLEERLAAYAGVNHAICCSSGTDGLLLALMACGVGPGDAIFTPPFTFVSTAEVICLLGATPVFVDIDPVTFNMDPDSLEKAIIACKENDPSIHPLPRTSSTGETGFLPKGIIAVDLFGLPADYNRINAIARQHRLFVIEDAAQSFGARYHGRSACSLATIASTSFFPAKPLGGYGDGGAVFTGEEELAEEIRSLRIHGKGNNKYDNVRIGLNARMDTLQAAFLLSKLDILPSELASRDRVASRYTTILSSVKALRLPSIPSDTTSAWAQYSVLAERREAIRSALRQRGIPTAVYYPRPLHLQPAFAHFGYHEGDFPESERVARRIFSLPMSPYLCDRQVERIAAELTSIVQELSC